MNIGSMIILAMTFGLSVGSYVRLIQIQKSIALLTPPTQEDSR